MESKITCPMCKGKPVSKYFDTCSNCNSTGYIPSPNPQVQSGLSAEEVLNKYGGVFGVSHSDAKRAMEEYAASKVAEKEREIVRLSGLLKEQHIKNVINIHQDNPERERFANSSWSIYSELHNIQQPDKI